MEYEEGILVEPVSPIAQYCNSSAFQLSIIGVWEFSIPIDEQKVELFVGNAFLPINPRFSSIMVGDINETQRWKKVEVKLEDHIYSPIFHSNLLLQSYDRCLDKYISDISLKAFPENKPMWEIHIIKYPTINAASSLVFRLHHALGDGYSFMSALLSLLQRADNPALPLTFPSRQRSTSDNKKKDSIFTNLPHVFSMVFKTVSDFSWSFWKSSFLEDDQTPIRSGNDGVEFQPTTITTIFFPLGQIKLIKTKLGVTINDAICGIIFFGVRLYMHEFGQKSDNSNSTALVLLNTRKPGVDYKSVKEMRKPEKINMAWGNRFGFLHIQIPKFNQISNPLDFVCHSQNEINRKRSPFAVYLNTTLWRIVDKFKGRKAAARYVHSTVRNASMTISNMIGPLEQVALGNYPITGLYFTVAGIPEDLGITIVSYMGKLRVVLKMEKEYMDSQKLKSCVENAFETIVKATHTTKKLAISHENLATIFKFVTECMGV